jgi:hypothetical protein
MAEIVAFPLNRARGLTEKAYIWPVYDAGKLDHIHGVTQRTESNGIYAKPLPEEHIRLLQELREAPPAHYSARGLMSDKRLLAYTPGTFFDALA